MGQLVSGEKRKSGYERHPEHRVVTAKANALVRVLVGGVPVAETTRAVRLVEGGYPPVFYIPREDTEMDHFSKSAEETHCPFKGDARYFDVEANGKKIENAAWTYEDPFVEVEAIKDHLAFYPNKVSVEVSFP